MCKVSYRTLPVPNSSANTLTSEISGKPGYGKTTLCTTLIEHLLRMQQYQRPQAPKSIVAFFYFDKQRPDSVSSSAAWKSIATQLLYAMSAYDPDVVEIFLMLRATLASLPGRLNASGK